MKKRPLLIVLLLLGLIAIVALLWYRGPWTSRPDSREVMASGTMDATEVAISFRMPGILRSRPVDEGSNVKAGELLASLDSRDAEARLHQTEAAEQAAQARLKDLEQGFRPQEIAEAKAQLEQVHANLSHLQDEAKRSETLFQGGAVSRQRRDKDQTAAAVAQEQYRAAQERLKLLQSGYRKESVNAARAQLKEVQAAVESARVTLEDLQAKSPLAGVITRTHAEVGETVGAGRPVLTLTDISKPWVRVYIPENQIGKVRLGATARIKVDTFPDREFSGQVSYVASQAEFTPKNVQTQEERVKLVFAVNVTANNPDGALKPGMPADVYIKIQEGGAK